MFCRAPDKDYSIAYSLSQKPGRDDLNVSAERGYWIIVGAAMNLKKSDRYAMDPAIMGSQSTEYILVQYFMSEISATYASIVTPGHHFCLARGLSIQTF